LVTPMLADKDVINDPYEAAIMAAELTGLNDVIAGRNRHGMNGAIWLVTTGITGSRLKDLRERTNGPYANTAIHEIDAWAGKKNYHKAVAKGWLDPMNCIHHRDEGLSPGPGRRPYDNWSTRGPYEAMVHDTIRFMPFTCFPVELTDVPLINAIMSARKAKHICRRYRRSSRQRSNKPCDWRFLRCVWAGVGRCKNNPEYRNAVHKRFSRWMPRARKLMRMRGDLPPLPPTPEELLNVAIDSSDWEAHHINKLMRSQRNLPLKDPVSFMDEDPWKIPLSRPIDR